MNYLIESVFVGTFTLILYGILQWVLQNTIMLPFSLVLFILGVVKHTVGYVAGIQTAYCRMYNKTKRHAIVPTNMELVIEGIVFILVGKILSWFVSNRYIIAFMTGAGIHIAAESMGLHRYFLKERCEK